MGDEELLRLSLKSTTATLFYCMGTGLLGGLLWAALLPRITARVIIVHGTQDDLVPVANVAFMQARLTGARCVTTILMQGRNHFLPWNSADTVRDAVRQALEPTC